LEGPLEGEAVVARRLAATQTEGTPGSGREVDDADDAAETTLSSAKGSQGMTEVCS